MVSGLHVYHGVVFLTGKFTSSYICFIPLFALRFFRGFLHTVGATGSNPLSPAIRMPLHSLPEVDPEALVDITPRTGPRRSLQTCCPRQDMPAADYMLIARSRPSSAALRTSGLSAGF
jgi:hypothetical protein